MIEKVLEAYEAKISQKDSFVAKLKRMDLISKIIFWGVIVIGLIVCGGAMIFQRMASVIAIFGYIIAINISSLVLEKIRHAKWETNIKQYNEDLDTIAKVLKADEYNLYDKSKIKQLICKFYQSIEEYEKKREKKRNDINGFICTYVIPIIAFFAGQINAENSTNTEWVAVGLIIVVVIASGKYICSSIVELIGMISWNQVEKEKRFVLKLQDLLDRDFKIEQEDLLALR